MAGVTTSAAQIDLAAVRSNVAILNQRAGDAAVMAVVKADGYGHGLLPCAQAALDGGATWLGLATADEAIALRAGGIEAPALAWLLGPGDDWTAVVAAGVDVGVNAGWALDRSIAAAATTGRSTRVHLKIDSGLGRAGATPRDWPDLVEAAAKAQADGTLEVVGIWSHFAYADNPGHATIERQRLAFEAALEVAARAGVEPQVRHLANSAATLALPQTHYDLVRPGVAVYGLSPGPELGTPSSLGLTPAMTLTSEVALAKLVPAGQGVSYGHRYTTSRETTLALIPLGYADGVPRQLTNVGEAMVNGARYRIAGTVCMDQFVLDVGDDAVEAGDGVVLFGPGDSGEPTADDWANAIGTINYEIVTRIGARVPRTYRGAP
ncbi:MAG TPA: alanine racemase [Mycobacteriales bacterium]|jgi:alanine racemase|nr:alanine racemase [Mycobacteriales bacterium]